MLTGVIGYRKWTTILFTRFSKQVGHGKWALRHSGPFFERKLNSTIFRNYSCKLLENTRGYFSYLPCSFYNTYWQNGNAGSRLKKCEFDREIFRSIRPTYNVPLCTKQLFLITLIPPGRFAFKRDIMYVYVCYVCVCVCVCACVCMNKNFQSKCLEKNAFVLKRAIF